MHAVRLEAHVGSDRRIEIELPAEMSLGDVEVVVLADAALAAAQARRLPALCQKIGRLPGERLTREQADRYLAEERSTWE